MAVIEAVSWGGCVMRAVSRLRQPRLSVTLKTQELAVSPVAVAED